MKRLVATAVVLMLGAVTSFAQTTHKKAMPARTMAAKSGTSNALMRHEQSMHEAIAKNDWAAFKTLLAHDAWSIDENGPMSIADFLKMTEDPKFSLKYEFKTSDMKIVDINPSTKIVTYKLEQKGTFMNQPLPPTVYASTVWANKGGTWTAVFHQESTAKK